MADLSSYINIGANTANFVGEVTTTSIVSTTGNVTAANFFTAGSGGNITGANIVSAETFSASGQVVSNTIIAGGNLRLQPDPNNSGAYLDVYLTTGPDVHIAGNGENVIIGRDAGANVTIGIDGNVTVRADSGTPYSWTFENAGNLNFPQGGYIGAAGVKGDGTMLTGGKGNIASLTSFYSNVDALNYSSCVTVNADGTLNITTYGDGTGALGQWNFANATLNIPGNGIITTINSTSGTAGNPITIQGGAADPYSFSTSPGGNVNIQGGLGAFNDGGGGGQGGFVNISAGVSLDPAGVAGNVTINSGGITWLFDNGGNLVGPTSGAANLYAVNMNQSITWPSLSAIYEDTSLVLQGSDSVGITSPGTTQITAGTVSWSFDADGNLTNNGNIQLVTNSNLWNFDTNGTLTLPGNTLQLGLIGGNSGLKSVNEANITIDTTYTGGGGLWVFDTNGNLTLPVGGDLIVNSGNIVGSGASPAPSINGFDSISSITVSASGNVIANNILLNGGNIIAGNITTLSDSVYTIDLGTNTILNINGVPFDGRGPARGQVTIGGVTTTTEANGTWYYQATGPSTMRLYTNDSYGNPVDSATWTAYGPPNLGGGVVSFTQILPGANLVLNSNGYTTVFANDGQLNLPGGLTAYTDIGTDGNVYAVNLNASINVSATTIDISDTANISNANIANAYISNFTNVPQYWFKGMLSANQNLTASTDTIILYNNNTDPQGWGATASSNGHIVPNKAGWYEVISRVEFGAIAGNTSAQVNHQISVNGTQQCIIQVPNGAVAGAGVGMTGTALVQLNGATDYITTQCYSTINGQQCVAGNSTLLIIKWISS